MVPPLNPNHEPPLLHVANENDAALEHLWRRSEEQGN